MRYLIICKDPATGKRSAFYTEWFDAENHFNPEYDMAAIDLTKSLMMTDGETWQEIEEDYL